MEFLDRFIELMESGATDEELQAFVAQNPQGLEGVTRDELKTARAKLTGEQKDRLNKATVGAALYGEEEDTSLGAFLFGDPEATIKTGTGPLLSQKAIVEGTKVVVNQGVLNKIAQGIFGFARNHPKITGGAVLAGGTAAIGAMTDGGERGGGPGGPRFTGPLSTETGGEAGAGIPQLVDPRVLAATSPGGREAAAQPKVGGVQAGFNVMIVDHTGQLTGTPGALAVLSPQDIGVPFGIPLEQVPSTAMTFDGSTDLVNNFSQFVTSQGAPAGSLSASNPDRVRQAVFPDTVGDVKINTPVQVGGFQGGTLRDLGAQPGLGPAYQQPRYGNIPEGTGGQQAGERTGRDVPRTTMNAPVNIPANAELTPRAFDNFAGRSLVEWASYYARLHGVPLNILYGLIAHESGWNMNAVGDNGNSHGLAQIYQPTWGGQVSVAQSRDPRFALNWTARTLKERFNQYGDWKTAVAAHNSPVAANYLAQTGKFQNEKSARYVADIMDRANRSGLSDYLADTGVDTEIASSGSGSGVSVSPFEAPDPAQSRAYARETYQNLLGRDPTEEEFKKEVERINQIARNSYNQKVRNALGQESTAVDLESQFEEAIRASGEFAFHEETVETQSFTDYAAGIANMLMRGG